MGSKIVYISCVEYQTYRFIYYIIEYTVVCLNNILINPTNVLLSNTSLITLTKCTTFIHYIFTYLLCSTRCSVTYNTTIREKYSVFYLITACCYVVIVYGYYNSYNVNITGRAWVTEKVQNAICKKKKKNPNFFSLAPDNIRGSTSVTPMQHLYQFLAKCSFMNHLNNRRYDIRVAYLAIQNSKQRRILFLRTQKPGASRPLT